MSDPNPQCCGDCQDGNFAPGHDVGKCLPVDKAPGVHWERWNRTTKREWSCPFFRARKIATESETT
jgi:hypothetical protein